jgi:signal transduction histidine kinase
VHAALDLLATAPAPPRMRADVHTGDAGSVRASRGLRSGVLSLANDATDRLGFQARVRFDGPLDTVVHRERGDHLLAVLREALSNIIRHAHAESVDVGVAAGADLVLRVSNDGVGLDGEGAVEGGGAGDVPSHRSGKGLRNMAARAEGLGGTCTIGPRRPRGTLVEWRVPLVATPSAPPAPDASATPTTPTAPATSAAPATPATPAG